MQVTIIHQFLQNLVDPLKASEASPQIVDDIERMLQGLQAFADKPVAELAQFLGRCQQYEKKGQWPETSPPISGNVVDMATPDQYAQRLKKFLEKHVPATGPMSSSVPTELDALKSILKTAQLREMANVCGVSGTIQSGPKAIEKAFEQITGRKLSDALIEVRHAQIFDAKDDKIQLDDQLKKAEKEFNLTQIRKLAQHCGVAEKVRSKSDGIGKIRERITRQQTDHSKTNELFETLPVNAAIPQERINDIVKRLAALKGKAEPKDAPYQEIEEELQQLERELSVEEAKEAAKSFGIDRNLYSKSEAMTRIRKRIFERRDIRLANQV